MRTAHIVCHESGHHWFGGLVQTLTRDRGFIEESTTSYGEVACVAAALPALNNSAIYREMFAPPFQDTRGIHIGALFHALDEFTRPSLARTGIAGSIDGRYAKGAAFLHMVEDYLEAATGPVRALRGTLLACVPSTERRRTWGRVCCAQHRTGERQGRGAG